jgi:hypothetical protein
MVNINCWENVGCSVADPDPGSWIRDGRKSASGSGMNNLDHIFWTLKTIVWRFLRLKYSKSLMRFWDPGSGKETVWFRDAEKSDPGAGINIPDPPHWGCTVPIPKITKGKRLTTDIREKSLP